MTSTIIYVIYLFVPFLIYIAIKKLPSEKKVFEVTSNTKKVIGIGGGGSNIVEYLVKSYPNSYDPAIINSDQKALLSKKVSQKIFLKKDDNYGCGSNENCGLKLIDQSTLNKISEFISRSKKVYILATLGGGVGSGSTKAIVEYLYEQNIDIYLLVVYPFSWEGKKKIKRADDTLQFSKPYCKEIRIFKNDSLKKHYSLPMKECFNILNKSIDKSIKGFAIK